MKLGIPTMTTRRGRLLSFRTIIEFKDTSKDQVRYFDYIAAIAATKLPPATERRIK